MPQFPSGSRQLIRSDSRIASCVSLGMRASETNRVGARSCSGRRPTTRDSWIAVFSEKLIRSGSWLVTIVSI